MVTSTIPQQTPGASTTAQVSNGRRTRNEREDHSVSDGFDALLAMTHGTINEQIKKGGDRASGQMFEPTGDQTGGDKMAQLNSDYRSAVGEKADQLSDARIGLDARRAALLAGAENVDRPATGQGVSPTEVSATDDQGRVSPLQNLGPGVDRAAMVRSPTQEAARFGIEAQSRNPNAGFDAGAPPPVDTTRGVGAPAATVAIASPVATAAPSVAETVGELLGASRTGESSGTRATAASQGVTDQRTASNERQTRTSARSRQEPSSTSAEETKLVRQSNRAKFDKLIGSMRLRMGEHRSTAQLRLNPPELGRIRVDVRLVGKRLVVGIQAESETARELLSRRAEGLKETLKEHGIQVDRFDVVTNHNDAASSGAFVGGDPGGAKQFSGKETQLGSSFLSRAARSRAVEDHDGSEVAGTASFDPTVAKESRLDIRI